MAERKYSLNFVTTAELSGAKAAEAAVGKVGAAAKASVADLDTQGDAFEKTTGKAANFGNAMLQGSRGIQDLSVAGIPGIVNNLEGLATALGMTAGAAGGITLVAVAVDLLVKNWGSIKAAFGTPEEVRAFWSSITPEEAQVVRMQAMNAALENQAANYERLAAAKKATIAAGREEDKQLQERAELWKDIVPTPEERGDLPPLPGMGPETPAMKEARRKVAETQADTQAKVSTFQGLDAATEAQRKRVEDMARIATQDERRRIANASDRAEIDRLSAFENEGGPVPLDVAETLAKLRRQVLDRDKQIRSQINAVPGLTDGLTGDPEKDREALQTRAAQEREKLRELEQRRLQAARDAEESARSQAQAEQGVSGQAQMETEQASAAGFRSLGLPPAPGQFSGADSRGGLPDMSRLADGAAAQELREAAALMERAQADNNAAVRETAAAMRNSVEAQRASLAAIRQEIDALRASVGSLQSLQ